MPSADPARIDLDREYFGSDSIAIFRFALADPQVLALMEKVLAHNFGTQFGVRGEGFVKLFFQKLSRLPSDAGTASVYEVFRESREAYNRSGLHWADAKLRYKEFQLNLTARYLKGRVVDAGADDNNLGDYLLSTRAEVQEVIGTDIVERPGVKRNSRLSFRLQADLCQIPVEDQSADVIIIKHALHHMSYREQEELLRDCGRCLAPGGHIVIYEDTYSFTLPPINDSGSLHSRIVELGDSLRVRLLLACFDIWPQVYKDKEMRFWSTYRAMEEWEQFFASLNFRTTESIFYGMSDQGFCAAPLGVFALT